MADMIQPPLPEGFQRPGVPGAGNALDPAVRAKLRGAIEEAVMSAWRSLAHGETPPAPPAPPAGPAPSPAAPPAPRRFGAGPFPHGDVDLGFIAANVPADPPTPRRGAQRSFYFLRPEGASTPPPG